MCAARTRSLTFATEQLKDVVQDLYQIMVQVSSYDSAGRASKDVLSNEMYSTNSIRLSFNSTAYFTC